MIEPTRRKPIRKLDKHRSARRFSCEALIRTPNRYALCMPDSIATAPGTTKSQPSFVSAENALEKKGTRHEKFLADRERVMPITRLMAVTEPLDATNVRVGRLPLAVSTILRMYLLHQRYGLAEESVDNAIYDSQALRDLMGIDLSRESVPDATTLLKFRRLLVINDQSKALCDEMNYHLPQQRLLMRAGTIVDANIIAASRSTKNARCEHDPDMCQAKNGIQLHHRMKTHIGVDADSGIFHALFGTAANVNEATQAGEPLHGEEAHSFGGAGYRGRHKRDEAQGPQWLAYRDATERAPATRRQYAGSVPGEGRENHGEHSSRGRAPILRDQGSVPP